MRKIEGLEHRYNIIAARHAYGGASHHWETGDTYCSTITWEEAQAIAAALNGALCQDVWIVREIPKVCATTGESP